MQIEFTGLVGSGKSTLAGAARKVLAGHGWRVFSASQAVAHVLGFEGEAGNRLGKRAEIRLTEAMENLSFVVENPRLVRLALNSPGLRGLPFWHRRTIYKLFIDVAGRARLVKNNLREQEAGIFDEGLVHRAINLFAWDRQPLRKDLLVEYFQRIPKSDLAIFVTAPLEMSLQRAYERGLPERLRGRSTLEVERFMENSLTILGTGLKVFQQAGYAHICVANQRSFEQAEMELAACLQAWLREKSESYGTHASKT